MATRNRKTINGSLKKRFLDIKVKFFFTEHHVFVKEFDNDPFQLAYPEIIPVIIKNLSPEMNITCKMRKCLSGKTSWRFKCLKIVWI